MKSMKPAVGKGHGVDGDTPCPRRGRWLGTRWGRGPTTTHRSGTGPPAWRCGRRGARRAAPAQPPCPPGKARETCPQGVVVPMSHRPSPRGPYLPEELLHQGFGPAAVHRPLLGRVADVGRVQQQRQHLGFIDPGEGTPALRFVPKTTSPSPLPGPSPTRVGTRTHLSSCCRDVFMDFTCWKWQDMSVARTISITSARSSLRPGEGGKRRQGPASRPGTAPGMGTGTLRKLVLGEVDKDVHLVVLHHAEDGTDVVVLQHRAVVVEDGAVRPEDTGDGGTPAQCRAGWAPRPGERDVPGVPARLYPSCIRGPGRPQGASTSVSQAYRWPWVSPGCYLVLSMPHSVPCVPSPACSAHAVPHHPCCAMPPMPYHLHRAMPCHPCCAVPPAPCRATRPHLVWMWKLLVVPVCS